MTAPVLELHDIVVRAGGRTILEIAAFAIAGGEALALVGPNGAGKTTLLQVAALLKRPDQGTRSILGERVQARNAAALRRSLSVVFQHPLLFDVRVLDNAAAGLRFQGLSRADAERIARLWLDRFGVAHLAQRRSRGLSGGEAGRVALARAFATEPALLLLDEPFSALDAPTRAALLPTLRARLQETGTASLLVTHDLEEAFAFAGQIALLDGGRILARGDGPTLLARPPTRRAAELLDVANILPATMAGNEGDRILLALQRGGPLVRGCLADDAIRGSDGNVTLTLPPAAPRLLDPGAPAPRGWNALPGEIVAVAARPAGRRLTVATPAPLIIDIPWDPSANRWSTGEPVTVAFPPEAVHIIPEPF